MELILTLLTGPQSGHMMRVKGSRLIIGRGHGSKIRVPSGSVSRSHSLITWQTAEGGYFMIEDMGSTNGTFINAIQVLNPVVLLPGDDLFVGSIGFRVHYTMKPKNLKNLANMRSESGYPAPGAPPLPTQAIAIADSLDTEQAVIQTVDHNLPVADLLDDLDGFQYPTLEGAESDYVAVEDLDNLVPVSAPSTKSPGVPGPPSKYDPPPQSALFSAEEMDNLFDDGMPPIPFKDEHNDLDLDALGLQDPSPPLPPARVNHGLDNQFDNDEGKQVELSCTDLILPRDMHLAELAKILRDDSDGRPLASPPPPPPPKK